MEDQMSWRVELVLDSKSDLAESPWWDAATRQLLWIDLFAGSINSFDPAAGANRSIQVGQPVGMVVGRRGGGVVAAVRDGVGFADFETGRFDLVLGLEGHLPTNRANDGYCDPRGRLWVGTMAFDQSAEAGSLYCVYPDLAVEQAIPNTTTSNGIDWSPDGRFMYFADTALGRVDRFSFDVESGRVRDRKPFITVPREEGQPDGLTIDSGGDLWLALWGGSAVRRYSSEGELKEVIAVPASRVTSVAFGNPELDTLFITTARSVRSPQEAAAEPHAGSMFALRPGAIGLAPTPFAG
jgi:sugar lactone lactonase YvrE